jgi:hypothetical protein
MRRCGHGKDGNCLFAQDRRGCHLLGGITSSCLPELAVLLHQSRPQCCHAWILTDILSSSSPEHHATAREKSAAQERRARDEVFPPDRGSWHLPGKLFLVVESK